MLSAPDSVMLKLWALRTNLEKACPLCIIMVLPIILDNMTCLSINLCNPLVFIQSSGKLLPSWPFVTRQCYSVQNITKGSKFHGVAEMPLLAWKFGFTVVLAAVFISFPFSGPWFKCLACITLAGHSSAFFLLCEYRIQFAALFLSVGSSHPKSKLLKKSVFNVWLKFIMSFSNHHFYFYFCLLVNWMLEHSDST